MKIYIHDKCMEQLFKLPKAIQKSVLDFQKKYRENPKSDAINLESINTFKDKQLRTARITEKYRAIIRVPESGDNYFLLWVDNHDEAMDWAKNKMFQWNENTQTAQIFTSHIEEQVNEFATTQNSLFSGFDDSQLMAIGVPESQINLIKSLKDLNELGDAEKYLPSDAFENLFYLAEGINIEILIAEINDGKLLSKDTEEQINSFNNKRSFVEVDDELMTEIINGELSKWQVFLHPSQRKLVESNFKGSVKVTGGAGTGKTVVALHRLKHLSQEILINDSRKILFTTFTNSLTANLTTLIKKLSIDNSKFNLINIDSLVRDLAKENHLIEPSVRVLDTFNSKSSFELWDEILELNLSEFDTNFLASEYQNVILFNDINSLENYLTISRIGRGKPISRKQRMDIWNLVESYNTRKKEEGYIDRAELFNLVSAHNNSLHNKPFKFVIADEIQDLSNVELKFLRSLVEEKENDLFLVGDPYQKIYAKKLNFTAAGISVRGNRSKQLRINYRTSEEIKRLALSAVKGLNYDDFDGTEEKLNGYLSLFHGATPTYDIFRTKAEEIEAIVGFIDNFKEMGLNYNDIAIGFRTKDSLKELKNSFHRIKIPYTDITSNPNIDSNSVVLSTFHSLKGLEFKAIILCDVNNRTSPLHIKKMEEMTQHEKEDYFKSEQSLIYVAITRAINILKITGTGVKSEIIRL